MKSKSQRPSGVERIRRNPTLVFVPVLIVVTTGLVIAFRDQIWSVFSSPARIEAVVDSWGLWGPLVFVALQFVQVVIFVIPGEIPQIAGGYLFGLFPGTAFSVLGILLGSSFNFLLARILGVPFVRALFGERRLRSFDRIAHSPRAQIGFFLLFVIPGIPKDILCYVAGLSPFRFVAFTAISTLGRLPGIVGSAAMGDAAASKEWVLALVLLGLAVVLFLLGMTFRRRIHLFIERFVMKPDSDRPNGQSPGPESKDKTSDT